ncbi:hypothetical protein BK720_06185 [Bacillus thuringiensis serovar brasilensis]|nr:hypothetical protein BK720_06185 [Bacillus thuringiensis serovar brasilensis]
MKGKGIKKMTIQHIINKRLTIIYTPPYYVINYYDIRDEVVLTIEKNKY